MPVRPIAHRTMRRKPHWTVGLREHLERTTGVHSGPARPTTPQQRHKMMERRKHIKMAQAGSILPP